MIFLCSFWDEKTHESTATSGRKKHNTLSTLIIRQVSIFLIHYWHENSEMAWSPLCAHLIVGWPLPQTVTAHIGHGHNPGSLRALSHYLHTSPTWSQRIFPRRILSSQKAASSHTTHVKLSPSCRNFVYPLPVKVWENAGDGLGWFWPNHFSCLHTSTSRFRVITCPSSLLEIRYPIETGIFSKYLITTAIFSHSEF